METTIERQLWRTANCQQREEQREVGEEERAREFVEFNNIFSSVAQ